MDSSRGRSVTHSNSLIFSLILGLAWINWPEPTFALDDLKGWTIFEYTDAITTCFKSYEHPSEWQVKEYFSLEQKVSYSIHTSKNPDQYFELLSTDSARFYISKTANGDYECDHDRRHSYKTVFPWTYWSSSFSVTGLGALWSNAVAQKLEKNYMGQYQMWNRTMKYYFFFDQKRNNVFTKVEFEVKRPIWTDEKTVLDWVKDILYVHDYRLGLDNPGAIMETIELRKQLCYSSDAYSRSALPDLMKILTESEIRAYRVKYRTVIIDSPIEDDQSRRVTRFEIDEWFSFDHAMQTFMVEEEHGPEDHSYVLINQTRRKKLMQLFNFNHGTSVGYDVELALSGRQESCKFSSLASDPAVARLSPLMRRPVKMVPIETTNSTRRQNRAQLFGLGALLMNLADIRHMTDLRHGRSTTVHGHRVFAKDSGDVLSVEDHSRQIKFKFDGGTKMRHLYRVEIWDQVEGSPDPRLVLYIEAIQFRRATQFAAKLSHSFEVPGFCPPKGDFIEPESEQPTDEVDDGHNEHNGDSTSEQLPAESEFSFPSGRAWHAYLRENYKITSTWSVRSPGDSANVVQSEVTEYFMIDDGNKLLGRVDMIKDENVAKFLMNYNDDTQYKIQANYCEIVENIDDWLHVVSTEMHLAGYHQTYSSEPMRHFGLGGLWSLASRSNSVSFVGAVKSGTEPGQFVATWLLDDSPELTAQVSAKFSFITKPDRELVKLSFDAREEASVLQSVEIFSGQTGLSISISNIRVEPNKATGVDFEVPNVCPPTIRERVMQFPSILDELRRLDPNIEPGTKLSELDFELGYELLWATGTETVLLQVTEMNLPAKRLRVCSVDFVNQQTLEQTRVSFWTGGGTPEIVLEYQFMSGPRVCSRGPELEHLMEINAHLLTIKGIYQGAESDFAGLPLANLWNAVAISLERHPKLYHVETRAVDGEDDLHSKWSLAYDAHIGPLEFETRPDKNQLEHLKSVTIGKNLADDLYSGGIFMSFQLTFVGRVRNLASGKVPSGCKHVDAPPQDFPGLTRHLKRGERFWIRSEVVKSESVSFDHQAAGQLREAHFLNEWLALDEAYRSRYSSDAIWLDESQRLEFDQLIYPQTREYFDLTETNSCKTVPRRVRDGEAKLSDSSASASGFISESLFYSEHKVGFYGPLSVSLLSEQAKAKRILFDGEPARRGFVPPDYDFKLRFLDLFDRDRFRSWLRTDRWLVEHETFGRFVMIFSPQDSGVEATRLDRVQQVADESPLDIHVISYSSEIEPNRFEEFDKFLRIPVGSGCVRSLDAKRQAALGPADRIVFDLAVPFEFHYEASLKLVGHDGRLTSLPVLNTGRLMTCPAKWTTLFPGSIRVNHHKVHHLSGRTGATRRVVMRDLHSATRATVRLIDELSGSCRIDIDRSDPVGEERVIELNFDGQIVAFTMSQLVKYFQSTDGFERIQEFESARDKARKTVTVVQEASSELLKLNDELAGPGSIVRTYVRDATSIAEGAQVYHESAKLELVVHGKAHLTLQLEKMSFMECLEIALEAEASECFMDGAAESCEMAQRRRRQFEMVFEPVDLAEGRLNFDEPLTSRVTLRDFRSNRKALERDLERIFVTLPDRISVAQLGRVTMKYSAAGSKLVATFSLIEPVSLIHEFEQLFTRAIDFEAARKLSDVGVEVERRPATSRFKCADLCESRPHSCLAFSHCSYRVCTFLQIHDWLKLSKTLAANQTLALIEGNLVDDVQCSTHFWPHSEPYGERHHVDEIVDSIRSHISGQKKLNKFSLNLKPVHKERRTVTRFIGADLRELVQSVDGDELDLHDREVRLSDEFVFLAERSELDLAQVSAKVPTAKTMMFEFKNLIDCLTTCVQFHCQLVSYCSVSHVCSLVAGLTQWSQFEAMAAARHADRNHCVVYSWDYTRLFELFDETGEPSEFAWRETLASANECAARCHLEPECLSFDFCFESPSGQPEPTCYGQRSHVSFDRQLLPTVDDNKPVRAELSSRRCAHYSKLVLTDFEVIEGEKFADHKSTLFHGASLEHCAAVCRRDASCRSFEYCAPKKRDSTCYVEERPLRSTASNSTSDPDTVTTISQEDCSVYVLKRQVLDSAAHDARASSDSSRPAQSFGDHESPHIHLVGWSCVVAVALGSFIGIVHRKLVQRWNKRAERS